MEIKFKYRLIQMTKETKMSHRHVKLLSLAMAAILWLAPLSLQSGAQPLTGEPKMESAVGDTKPDLGSQNKSGVMRSLPTQEKKQIKNESPTPVGRPDLKPEFGRPERAPGPPLGERNTEEEKKRRQ